MKTVRVGRLDELDDPGCREFVIGDGDWPFRGFVVRTAGEVHAYQNVCVHAGHPLNWSPDDFLTKKRDAIICSSHGAMFAMDTGDCLGGPCKGRALRTVEAWVEDGVVFAKGPESA